MKEYDVAEVKGALRLQHRIEEACREGLGCTECGRLEPDPESMMWTGESDTDGWRYRFEFEFGCSACGTWNENEVRKRG